MFEYLFTIFDIPLVCILIMLVLFGNLLVKNIYNIFLILFIGIFLSIFIASTLLTQQIYLGEFLVISIFFLLAMIFFVFNLNNNFDDSCIIEKKKTKIKIFFSVLTFLLIFGIIIVNFYQINNTKNKFILISDITNNNSNLKNATEEQEYDAYIENISLINQNKIFQKLTHIIMFYICLVVVLYFFNRETNNEG